MRKMIATILVPIFFGVFCGTSGAGFFDDMVKKGKEQKEKTFKKSLSELNSSAVYHYSYNQINLAN